MFDVERINWGSDGAASMVKELAESQEYYPCPKCGYAGLYEFIEQGPHILVSVKCCKCGKETARTLIDPAKKDTSSVNAAVRVVRDDWNERSGEELLRSELNCYRSVVKKIYSGLVQIVTTGDTITAKMRELARVASDRKVFDDVVHINVERSILHEATYLCSDCGEKAVFRVYAACEDGETPIAYCSKETVYNSPLAVELRCPDGHVGITREWSAAERIPEQRKFERAADDVSREWDEYAAGKPEEKSTDNPLGGFHVVPGEWDDCVQSSSQDKSPEELLDMLQNIVDQLRKARHDPT